MQRRCSSGAESHSIQQFSRPTHQFKQRVLPIIGKKGSDRPLIAGEALSDNSLIPHSRPLLGDDVHIAAAAVTASGMIGHGPAVRQFENAFAAFHGLRNAVAVNSGSAALHLALLALNVRDQDEIIVPAYVCSAVLNSILYLRASPVLVDSNPDTFNVDVRDLRHKLTPRTKAIILPHMFGEPADVEEILKPGVPVIEDCAQSLGAEINGRKVGSFGAVSVFSFHATKMITTGTGGMVATNDPQIAQTVADLRDYDARDDFKLRYNYQMTDLAAAIGLRQLERLPEFIDRRRKLAALYTDNLAAYRYMLPSQSTGGVYYRYVVRAFEMEALITSLAATGIQAKRPVYKPLHHYIQGAMKLDGCERIFNTSVSIPLYPALSDADADRVIHSCAWQFHS